MEKQAFANIEIHPWQPFVPADAEYLFLGTFPPKSARWSMAFYYPNKNNDFWRVMGIVFYNDRDALWNQENGSFDLPSIKKLLTGQHIAIWDTARVVRRLKDNASDKFLEIVEAIDLSTFIRQHPTIKHIVATGEKAATVVAQQLAVNVPQIGTSVDCKVGNCPINFWRMPSTSRAYPLALEKKAACYQHVFGR